MPDGFPVGAAALVSQGWAVLATFKQDFQAIGRCCRSAHTHNVRVHTSTRKVVCLPIQHYLINADDMRLLGIPR